MIRIEEPTPTRNEVVPSTKIKTNIGTAIAVIFAIVSAVVIIISFKRDVEDISRRQVEEIAERKLIRDQIAILHENMWRLAYSVDPKTAATLKPLQPATATP